MKKLLPVALLALLAARAVFAAPSEYIMIDWDNASPLVLVADVRPGGFIPFPPEPEKPNQVTIALNEALWFRARVHDVVYGSEREDKLDVMATSHWGMRDFDSGKDQFLVAVLRDGPHYVMPRYASTRLIKGPDGDWIVPLRQHNQLHWLPCSVADLKQEFDAQTMAKVAFLKSNHGFESASKKPELFHVSETGAIPRFGIAVSRIRQHLANLHLKSADMSCKKQD